MATEKGPTVCAWCGNDLTEEERKPPPGVPRPGPDYGLVCTTCRGEGGEG
jgi:hypothetical protein